MRIMVLHFRHQFLNIGLNIRKSMSTAGIIDSTADQGYECRDSQVSLRTIALDYKFSEF